ncbi:hypothetical protein [Pseudoduganella namucuonensis]|uniref:hypothetical protein n=1 Tax=Pseudoduganella namucuonensis TaxID=1035707 RepID=UPI001E6291DC|nr:hypothetical protein [Pseudoduganella namucuonensis]
MLSLLLVLSQQMGITHAVSHLSDIRNGGGQQQRQQLQDRDTSASRTLALDQNCEQCLAFAQIAAALDTPSYTFPVASHAAPVSVVTDTPLACQRTVCVFQSRAPPQFA